MGWKASQRTVLPALLLGIALVALLPTGLLAGGAPAGNDIVTVRSMYLPNASSSAPVDRADVAVMRRFQELHPNIRLVEGQSRLKMAGGVNMDMMPLMQIAGDIAPDLIYVCNRQSGMYINAGFLKPMDEYVAAMNKDELDRRVPPSIRNICYRRGPDGKKHWYALPTWKYVMAIAYRKDIFLRAGMDPDKPPRTWKELEEYCVKLTKPEKNKWGMQFSKGDGASWELANFIWSRGGDIVVRTEDGESGPSFNTPEVVDALYFYVKLNRARHKGADGKYYRGYTFRDQMMGYNVVNDPLMTCGIGLVQLGQRMNVV